MSCHNMATEERTELLGILQGYLIQHCPDWGWLPGEADGWAEFGVSIRLGILGDTRQRKQQS